MTWIKNLAVVLLGALVAAILILASTVQTHITSLNAAEFRAKVRDAAGGAYPLCAVSADAENDVVLAKARKELAALRSVLTGTPRGQDFDIAWADLQYEASVTAVECAEPDSGMDAEIAAESLARMRKLVGELRRML